MGKPGLKHRILQENARALLAQRYPGRLVLIESPFEIADHDIRSADVAVTEMKRVAQAALALKGAPEIVVEVLSPSNTVAALKEFRRLCFASGTEVFLTLDPDDHTVEVQQKGQKNRLFAPGEQFEIEALGIAASFSVDALFAPDLP